MSKATIELLEGYFVEVDELNHTLKHKKTVLDKKTGEKKEVERIIGYFPNVQACLERVVRLISLDENDGAVISLLEYAKSAEKAFNKVREWKEKNEC